MKQMEVSNLLQVQPTYKTPVRIFLLDMKNFILANLINVVWERLCWCLCQSTKRYKSVWTRFYWVVKQPAPKRCLLLFCNSHGFFPFFFFLNFFSGWSHYILENCKCLGLECFLIKITNPFQSTKPSTSFTGAMPAIWINLPNAMTSGASRAFPAMGHPCDAGWEKNIY